jgi:hypothetical protein
MLHKESRPVTNELKRVPAIHATDQNTFQSRLDIVKVFSDGDSDHTTSNFAALRMFSDYRGVIRAGATAPDEEFFSRFRERAHLEVPFYETANVGRIDRPCRRRLPAGAEDCAVG